MSERIVNDPSLHGWVEEDGKWVWDGTDGGVGAGMVVSETEPSDKEEGLQWLNPSDGYHCFWDGEKWLQMPGGKNGADGNIADATEQGVIATWDDAANSGAGQWTPDSSLTINASGDATFSGQVTCDKVIPAGGLHTYLWVHGADDQIGLTINRDFNRVVPYGNSKNQMDLGADSSKFKDGYFTSSVGTGWLFYGEEGTNLVVGAGGGGGSYNRIQIMNPDDSICIRVNATNANGVGADAFMVDQQGNGTFKGTITKNGNQPVTTTRDLIETLSTLRTATQDETIDVRQALASACDKLIEKFESMQEVATQEVEND